MCASAASLFAETGPIIDFGVRFGSLPLDAKQRQFDINWTGLVGWG